MRIMLDTNVLLSVLLFPGERMDRMMRYIIENHRLVLSSFVLDELTYVVEHRDQMLCAKKPFYNMKPEDRQASTRGLSIFFCLDKGRVLCYPQN